MSNLERIIATGNRGHRGFDETSIIVCADGFTVSVIAGGGTYCAPRPALCSHSVLPDSPIESPSWGMWDKSCDYPGPFRQVEVGFPSARPEPWEQWSERFEDFGDTPPTAGVYGYVPVEMIRALVASHGGEA